MKSSTKIIIGTGAVLAGISAAAAASYALTNGLVKIALEREEPKYFQRAKKHISGTPEIKELNEEISVRSKEFESLDLETVEITGRDGEKLVGHFYKCPNEKRIIIAMHGWRSSWKRDFCEIYKFWYENGCSVLYAEQRGQGESGGDYMGFGMMERFDCADWATYMNERTKGSVPIYLAGISMGATTVLMTSSLDLPESVKGIMADCGFTSAAAIWEHVVSDNMHLSYTVFKSLADDICKKYIKMGADDFSATDALKETQIPVLFIHGTDDQFVPVEMTYENYKACAAPKRLLIVPGADHGLSFLVDEKAYKEAVLNFFKDFD